MDLERSEKLERWRDSARSSSKNIILVNQQTRSFNGNIEYIDEVLEDDEAFNLMSDIESDGNVEAKRRRANLRIDATDKRPKCQPVGAQIDCR